MSRQSQIQNEKSQSQIIEGLSQILADTYVLYVKTQNFHWNIIDSRFAMLHKLFEKNYEQLAEQIDELAERIRKIDGISPGSMREFLEFSTLDESNSNLSGDEMIDRLYKDHKTIISHLRTNIAEAQKNSDEGTADLLIQQLREHEKVAWMLKSHL